MNKKEIVAFVMALNALFLTACSFKDEYSKVDVHDISEDTTIIPFEQTITPEESGFPIEVSPIIEEEQLPVDTLIIEDSDSDVIDDIKETIIDHEEKPIIQEVYSYAALINDSDIFEDIEMGVINNYIERYHKVYVNEIIDNRASIILSNGYEGYINASDIRLLPETFVEIDISDQTLWLYKDGEMILTTPVVTGKNSSPTNIGYFDIDFKTTKTYLKGPTWKSWVEYWMPFDGDIGLHDANWRSEFGGEIYQYSGSHGCVNMPPSIASSVYENVETGTIVLVHK